MTTARATADVSGSGAAAPAWGGSGLSKPFFKKRPLQMASLPDAAEPSAPLPESFPVRRRHSLLLQLNNKHLQQGAPGSGLSSPASYDTDSEEEEEAEAEEEEELLQRLEDEDEEDQRRLPFKKRRRSHSALHDSDEGGAEAEGEEGPAAAVMQQLLHQQQQKKPEAALADRYHQQQLQHLPPPLPTHCAQSQTQTPLSPVGAAAAGLHQE